MEDMDLKTTTIPLGRILVKVTSNLSAIFAVLWLIFLLMPNRWHYKCLGETIHHEHAISSDYVVKDPYTRTAKTYEDVVFYRTDEGDTCVAYYYDVSKKWGLFGDYQSEYCRDNSWQYAYSYRMWTNNFIYLGLSVFFLLCYWISCDNRDWKIDIEVKPEKKRNVGKKGGDGGSVW